MSFRGRGRGRGRGGFGRGGFRPGVEVSWELFPEIEDLGTAAGVVERLQLAKYYTKLQSYWKASPYYYEGDNDVSKKAQRAEIERFSDKITGKTKPKPPLSHFIKMEPEYVPAELARGEKKEKRGTKRVRWNQESDMQKLDLFEKLEQKYQGQDRNEKKEDEGEEEDEERVEEDEEEYSDDGDYNQNIDFDDDEDDFNMADDNDDEGMF